MNRVYKIGFAMLILAVSSICWLWLDSREYFQLNYRDLTTEQNKLFERRPNENNENFIERFSQHITDTGFIFPRQAVNNIKIFNYNSGLGTFSKSKTLKKDKIENFISFVNDTTNFNWQDGIWDTTKSDYLLRLYNVDNKIIGKVFVCLGGCGRLKSRPFCPSMKFGALTLEAFIKMQDFIINDKNWESK